MLEPWKKVDSTREQLVNRKVEYWDTTALGTANFGDSVYSRMGLPTRLLYQIDEDFGLAYWAGNGAVRRWRDTGGRGVARCALDFAWGLGGGLG